MQSLIPTIFAPTIERIPHLEGRPDFIGLQSRRPVMMLERAYVALSNQQHAIGRRIISPYTGADAPKIRYWSGEDLNQKRVAYLHDGMLGDECIHTAVYAQLRFDYPQINLHVFPERYASENHRVCSYNRDIGLMPRNKPFGFAIDQVESFDYWITPVNVGADFRARSEKTQYELLEDDLQIELQHKIPYLHFAEIERRNVRSLVARGVGRMYGEGAASGRIMSLIDSGNCIIVQLNASEVARTPSPLLWVAILTRLQQAVGDTVFVICGSEEQCMTFHEYGGKRLRSVVYEVSNSLTEQIHLSAYGLLYFVERARLAITPDSYLMHAAAAYDVPNVAIWQDDERIVEEFRIPSPRSRIRHYEHCEAVGMSTEPDQIMERILGRLQ